MTGADRVAITGMGIVSPLGTGVDPFTEALLAGRTGILPLDCGDMPPFIARHAAQVPGFVHGNPAPAPCRHLGMALAAAAEAIASSGVEPSTCRVGLVFATCVGPLHRLADESPDVAACHRGMDPEREPDRRLHGATIRLAQTFGITGPITTIATACAASTGAICRAADWLRCGHADMVLVGGADAFTTAVLAGFDRLRTTSPSPCAPFSLPPGLTLGEGAGFWLLEPEAAARQRGASIRGFVLGGGLSNDAHHPTTPDPTGAGIRRCIDAALRDARLSGAEVGHVNTHGSGTLANDRTECRAIARAFDDAPPPVCSTKAAIGHALGAAGILEASASLLALDRGLLPPTLNFTSARDGCDLDVVANTPRPTTATRFLSQNLAFHGHNAAIALGTRLDPPTGPAPALREVALVAIAAASEPSRAGEEAASGGRSTARGTDDATRLATRTTRSALAAAGVPDRAADRAAVGLVFGQCSGPSAAERRFLDRWHAAGPDAPDLVAFPFAVPSALPGALARELGLKAWSTMSCAGHGAGLDAVGCAVDAIGLGHAPRIAAGAVDAEDVPLPEDAPANRATVVVLESEASARERRAPVLARVVAWEAAFVDELPSRDPVASVTALLARALARGGVAPATVTDCCLSADPTPRLLVEAAARLLPAATVHADPPFRAATPTHGTAALSTLASLLDGRPLRTPVVVATMSRHGETRVLVLAPAEPATREATDA